MFICCSTPIYGILLCTLRKFTLSHSEILAPSSKWRTLLYFVLLACMVYYYEKINFSMKESLSVKNKIFWWEKDMYRSGDAWICSWKTSFCECHFFFWREHLLWWWKRTSSNMVKKNICLWGKNFFRKEIACMCCSTPIYGIFCDLRKCTSRII